MQNFRLFLANRSLSKKGENFRLNLFHEKEVKFSRNKTCENFAGWIWVNVGGLKER